MKLRLPYPPSANRYWRVWRGRAVKSTEARAYQAQVKLMNPGGAAFVTPVAVSIRVYRPAKRGDVDNAIKVLLDSLKGIAFVDDKQVVELHAYRFDDKHNPRAEVEIYAAAI
jgi:crossover junction endodeoxyribonuclease RusA